MADRKKRPADGTPEKKRFRLGGAGAEGKGQSASANARGTANDHGSSADGRGRAAGGTGAPTEKNVRRAGAEDKSARKPGKSAGTGKRTTGSVGDASKDRTGEKSRPDGRPDKNKPAEKNKTAEKNGSAGKSAAADKNGSAGNPDGKAGGSNALTGTESAEREKQRRSGIIRRSLVATLEREAEQQREAALAGLSPYYIKISSRFRLAKIITAMTLAVFIVVMLSVFRNDITPENISYMIRDLGVTNTVYSNTSSVTITYESDTSSVFGLFRDSLAVSDSSGFYLYSREGGTIFSEAHSYEDPRLALSGAYAVTYDLGGTSYSVYNSLGRISEGTTAYPIYMAAASDSGSYVILTRSAEYRTVAYIYDGKGKNTAQIFKDKYAVSADFSSGGTLLYITSIDERDGSLSGEISVYDPREGSTVYTVDTGTAVVADAAFDGSTLTAVTSRSLLRVSPSGGMTAEYGYGSFVPSTWCFGDGYSVIAVTSEKVSGQSDIVVLGDTLGEEQSISVTGEVKRMCSSGDYVYALLSGSVLRLDVRSGETAEYSYTGSPCDIHVGNGTLWLCYYSQSMALSEQDVFSGGR